MNAAPTLAPMLRKLRLWVNLGPEQEQALLDLPHTVVALEKQRVIVREGDDVSHCWVALSGYCIRFKFVGNGTRQIVSIHMKGDMVDMHNALLGVADHSVQTSPHARWPRFRSRPFGSSPIGSRRSRVRSG